MIKLNSSEYAKRRQALMASMSPNSIAIVPSAPVTIRNRDVEHAFRQDSDFYYLSGFHEEHSVLVLIPGREQAEYVLFCQEKIKEQEKRIKQYFFEGKPNLKIYIRGHVHWFFLVFARPPDARSLFSNKIFL